MAYHVNKLTYSFWYYMILCLTSQILVATGPQDPTAFFTQSFGIAVAPQFSVANKN